MNPKNWIVGALSNFDVTEVFKTKGDLKRWSAKRTVGGVIALTACNDVMTNGVSWAAVVMCAVAIIPISLSFFEGENA